ncbi:MAG: protein translocase subunit SecD [Deltaproteobacteria bacterium]|nr:protein translocase subunit SecD [Deltaproteobacteria bacterium]
MERSWWWKAIGIFLLTALAVVYLLPSVVAEEALPNWYKKRVKAKLGLGLDLQGGIHLVYEVEVNKAVSDKADRLAIDLEQRLQKDKKVSVYAARENRDDIVLKFKNPADIKAVDNDFMADFRNNLTEIERSNGQIRLRLDEQYVTDTTDYAIRQAKATIRGRIDEFGVAEPSVMLKGRDIVVELPGLTKKDFDRIKKLIGRTAQLEFKICDDESDVMRQAAALVKEGGPIEVRTEDYDGKQRGRVVYTALASKDKRRLQEFLENLPKNGVKIPADREILLGEERALDKKGNPLQEKVWVTHMLRRRTELSGEYITDAQVQWDDRTQRPEVGLTFDRTGANIFAKVSGDNIGYRMAIVLDGKVNSAPVLQSRIGGGRARITLGGFRSRNELMSEARDLAAVLRAGALPAPLRKTFERQVGATLGADAVKRGTMAFMIGGLLVVLFILYYYRGAGLICDIALVLNVIYILAIMAGFNASLTLPGIAGIVLTIGMAVDANVIIYERIREEAALGKTPRAAVDAGYARAFWTIFDAQLTTAIAAIVLLQWGSGPIRGFGVTLLIGIVCSVFTGVFVTRLFFDFVINKFKPKKLSI